MPATRTRRALAVAALTTLVVVLAGCGDDTGARASTTPTASAGPTPTPAPVPRGMRLVTATKAGVAFAVPRAWTAIDATTIDQPQTHAVLERVAQAMNLPLERLIATFRAVDLMVTHQVPGFAPNINVTRVPRTEPFTEDQLRDQAARVNAEVLDFATTSTPLGQANTATTRLPLPDGENAIGESIFVPVGDHVVSIVVTTDDRALSEDLAGTVLRTLRRG